MNYSKDYSEMDVSDNLFVFVDFYLRFFLKEDPSGSMRYDEWISCPSYIT
jgi:hypothetical protein